MRVGLTKIQHAVLTAIRDLTVDGMSPTLEDLAARVGLKSRGNVHNHLVSLRKKGRITWDDNKAQSIRIIEDGTPTELTPMTTDRKKALVAEVAAALALDIGASAAADHVTLIAKRLRKQALREAEREQSTPPGQPRNEQDEWRTASQWRRPTD
jgi:SOS-response transcriptional repressor LexA